MHKVNLDEAQKMLPELIEEAANGEDVQISRGDGASFRIVPVETPDRRPVLGSAKGLIKMSDDFDDPIEGFEPYMPQG